MQDLVAFEEYKAWQKWTMCICGRLVSKKEILAWLLSVSTRLTADALEAIKGEGAIEAEAVSMFEKVLRLRVSNAEALKGVEELASSNISSTKQIQAVFDSVFNGA